MKSSLGYPFLRWILNSDCKLIFFVILNDNYFDSKLYFIFESDYKDVPFF